MTTPNYHSIVKEPSSDDDEVEKVSLKADKLIESKLLQLNELKQTPPVIQDRKSVHSPLAPLLITYELPRDVLTAYILIRLENDGQTDLWTKYGALGQMGIMIALATPIVIQFTVATTLISEIDWRDADRITDVDPQSVWYNLISLAVLFIYMFRDVHGYTANVWKFIGRVENEQQVTYNPLHRSRLKDIGLILKRWDYHNLDPREIDFKKQKRRCLFIQFRLMILGVFVLYGMLTFYSLIQIAVTDGLADKLEVSLAIFFLLEVDDWAYDLFISQNNILDDVSFDIQFPLKEQNQASKFERDVKNLWCSLWILFGSLMLVVIFSILYNPV